MGHLQRREILTTSMAAIVASQTRAFAQPGNVRYVPWSDQPPPVPNPLTNVVKDLTPWDRLDSWITPSDNFFAIGHYEWPAIDEKTWHLEVVGGERPVTLTIDQLRAMPRREIINTIECSGSNGLPFITSAVGNAQWAGVSLADVLGAANIKPGTVEIVFHATDRGEEVLRKDTPLELKINPSFARSMPLADAMDPENILAYEMNGAPLPERHGFPLRLIAPGWYGVANVKWIQRIELTDQRFLNRFMGRDYVTVHETAGPDGKIRVSETSVGRMRVKSAPARITEQNGRFQIIGMAWGPQPIRVVEVKIDDGPWTVATFDDDRRQSAHTWRFWHLDWPSPASGEHTITSRAVDMTGTVQPAMDDPWIATKKTYWESNGQITRHVQIA
jgi:DMSO/TMAO reductase YedYZ molybdopterin-dependent catalytic subunit